MNTNRSRLVVQNLIAQIAPPLLASSLYDVGADGVPRVLPSVGGVTLNVRVGASAFGFEADHVEPAVSVRHADDRINTAFCTFACVGNVATVIGGEAKGEQGVVTGKHGGVEHVMIDFPEKVMERMQIGDAIGVRAVGVGLEIEGAGDVKVFNCDPDLLDRLGIERSGERLSVPVACRVPARVMGSGLGRQTVVRGDYDIQCFDAARSVSTAWTGSGSATSSPSTMPTTASAASTAAARSPSASSRTARRGWPDTGRA